MTIRIRALSPGYGYIVSDAHGWEAAAVCLADAEALARHRVNPQLPAPPPGVLDEATIVAVRATHPLAVDQFEHAVGDLAFAGAD